MGNYKTFFFCVQEVPRHKAIGSIRTTQSSGEIGCCIGLAYRDDESLNARRAIEARLPSRRKAIAPDFVSLVDVASSVDRIEERFNAMQASSQQPVGR
jgi:hypothetical protein